MAHWAQIDDNGVVLQVTVGNNDEPDEGYQWLIDNIGGIWVKTSYNTVGGQHYGGGTPLRYNYAAIGYTFSNDPQWADQQGAFIPPQPFPSWVVDSDTALWVAPMPPPEGSGSYDWDEGTTSWVPSDVVTE